MVRRRRVDGPIRAFATRGRPSVIAGIGAHLPERVVTNDELATMIQTTDAWIVQRTGVRERRIARPHTATFELATAAARATLESAGVGPDEVDVVIVTSSTPDAPFPSMACRVQDQVGAVNAWAFDLLAACAGLLYGVSIADAMVSSDRAETVLIIGAEVISRIMDWADRSTCVLFADAAAAVLVRPARAGGGFLSWSLGADGRAWDLLVYGEHAEKGAYVVGDADARVRMRGPEVYKFAVDNLARQAVAATRAAGLEVDDIDLFVPHQANRRIIEAAAQRAGIPPERVLINIDRHGNTSTATIPLALRDALLQGRLAPGDHVLLASFGAGLAWGACVLRWE